MRQFYAALGVAMLWCGWVNLTGAQTTAPLPAPDYSSPLADNTANLVAGPPRGCGLDEQAWSVNLLL